MAQAVPVTVLGTPQDMGGTPYGLAVAEPQLPPNEAVVLNYRCSMRCFTVVDASSTLVNIVSSILSTMRAEEEVGSERSARGTGIFGNTGLAENTGFSKWGAFLGLIFIVGPICGYVGAVRLRRSLVGVYLAFCLGKTFFEICLAILTPHPWLILFAFIQVWVAKIVFTFWRALGTISPERCEQLRNPEFLYNAPARVVYW